jgi:hypothetical protein
MGEITANIVIIEMDENISYLLKSKENPDISRFSWYGSKLIQIQSSRPFFCAPKNSYPSPVQGVDPPPILPRALGSPKFYLTDPSLVCFLTRQPAPGSVLRGNMGGAIFEGLIVTEAWKTFLNRGKEPALFFWRS